MTTGAAEIRELSDAQLSDLWRAGSIDLATLEAECARRDQADKRKAKASAERAAWLDAAHAQYLAADAECAGHLVADGAEVADALSLWRGSEAWARRMASEELNNYWDAHGRLSLAEYQRQQAMARRAERDARDLAAMPAAPERPERPERRPAPAMRPATARELAEQAARAPRPAPTAPGSIARYITALGLLERKANATARALARVNGGMPR